VSESGDFSDAVRWKEKGDPVVEELELRRAALINVHLICEVYPEARINDNSSILLNGF
jgi:hypothetical protein